MGPKDMKLVGKFHFWATIITAFILGSLGFFLAGLIPLPAPFRLNQTRLIYALVGVLIGLLSFAQVSSWVAKVSTRLFKQLISRLAFEIFNQFNQVMSRGRATVPALVTTELSQDYLNSISGSIVLDTSSIIDGRVLDVAKTGFLCGIILLPAFVLRELQQVADSSDNTKRSRGRRGFEVVEGLKRIEGIKLEIWDHDVKGKNVDDKLIRLGKILHGKVLTADFNLNRVARLSGVQILNLNELSNALKTLPIPGETLNVKIIQYGKDKNQGVGYLGDGTMVVVKDAASLIGQEIPTEVNKILQGPSGRMIFGKIIS